MRKHPDFGFGQSRTITEFWKQVAKLQSRRRTMYDAIIIGAGQAGSAAAHRLALRYGHKVLLLEAADHVGGRTRNVDVASGRKDLASDDVFELGGTWISSDHTAVLGLCEELKLELYHASFLDRDRKNEAVGSSTNGNTDTVDWPWWFWGVDYSSEEMERIHKLVLHTNNNKDGAHRKVAFSTPGELYENMDKETLEELQTIGTRLNSDKVRVCTNTTSQNCWECSEPGPEWAQLDKTSTSEALGTNLSTLDAQCILRNLILDKNAQESDHVSYLFNLFSFKGCNSSGADLQYRVRGGTQALPLRIAELLGESSVLLNSPVHSIRRTDGDESAVVEVQTRDGRVFISRAVVVTGSPHAVKNIVFQPSLPKVQRELLHNMPLGRSMKFAAVYHKGPWWRECGLQGDIICSGLPDELSFRIPNNSPNNMQRSVPFTGYCFDTSTYSRQFGVLACFIEGMGQERFSSLSEDQRKELMRKFLQLTFEDIVPNSNSAPIWEPDEYICGSWGPGDNDFVGGAYTSYFPPGVLSKLELWNAYRQVEKLPNIFLAGADYHAGYGNGYIEGALRSGHQVAEIIHGRLEETSGLVGK
jgi:putrescine oxidase